MPFDATVWVYVSIRPIYEYSLYFRYTKPDVGSQSTSSIPSVVNISSAVSIPVVVYPPAAIREASLYSLLTLPLASPTDRFAFAISIPLFSRAKIAVTHTHTSRL